jgi:hypothetical protein
VNDSVTHKPSFPDTRHPAPDTRVADAKAVARQWVNDEARTLPGFAGAFFHGSVNWLPDDASLPWTYDLDVMVVLKGAAPAAKPGKFAYHGVLLEVSYLPSSHLGSAEEILGQSHLAGSFHRDSIIADPTGRLTTLQKAVARDYSNRKWVRRRCEHTRDKILTGFQMRESDPFPDHVNAWLFPAGITTHVLLVAGLMNPTVRTRYLAVRELLEEYGRLDIYELLLRQLGCADMSQERARERLTALAEAFDAAQRAIATPFFFAADISDVGRAVAIDGSRELIARGDHREAVFWMAATYSRCQLVFHYDAPELYERFDRGYRDLLGDLGIASFADLQRRHDAVVRFLPQVWEMAELIMAASPDIDG